MRWILDLDPDFPSSAEIARRVDATIVSLDDLRAGRFPDVPGPVVGYGTMRAMLALRRHPRLGAGVSDDYASLRCSSYYRHVYEFLGRAAVIVPLRALRTLALARMFGSRVFVRPDTNLKLFPAEVWPVDRVGDLVDRWPPDELVVLSDVVEITAEYRCFFRRGLFVGGSSYPTQPYTPVPEDVRVFAGEVARRLLDAGLSMVTVDVASGDRLRLVEVGGVNSWGLYGCDVDAFIAAMEAEARSAAEDI